MAVTSASDRTEEAVSAVQGDIKVLADDLSELIILGQGLVNNASWQGPKAESFRDHWMGRIKPSLDESVENLTQINKQAHESQDAIRVTGDDRGGSFA